MEEKLDKILDIVEKLNSKVETIEEKVEYIMSVVKMPFYWAFDKINTIRNKSTINDQD
tara:strand:+ start:1290 stop:1463 length:174 start_codon:yes stop_codon:yes gene_type:complete